MSGRIERTDDIAFYKNFRPYIIRELLGHVRKRNRSYFGHLCRVHGCQITTTVVERYVVGRTSKTREATQTVGLHGKHQAEDKNNNITVRTGCRRPQSLEGNRQSSDAGQQSNMICRNEEDTAHTPSFTHFLTVPF